MIGPRMVAVAIKLRSGGIASLDDCNSLFIQSLRHSFKANGIIADNLFENQITATCVVTGISTKVMELHSSSCLQ